MNPRPLLLLPGLLLAGCVGLPTQQQIDYDRIAEESRPQCVGEADCRAKWEAAQIWLTRHSGFKIQVATDVLIETYNPTGYSPNLAMRITKEPQGGGRYLLRLEAWCANVFGCSTDPRAAVLQFNGAIQKVVP